MVSINYSAREVCCKIVYYGPGLSGKTTNLQYVHAKVPQNSRGKLISLATEADRTLYFDFLPINIGTINGFQAKFQLYTVPGQVYYNATRKLVLRGVDGIVFVADSQPDKMDENIESLTNLEENLHEYGYNAADIPMVIQFNKRDLPGVMSVEALNARLNPRHNPHFEASATIGNGVFDTLKLIIRLVLEKAKTSQVQPTAVQVPKAVPVVERVSEPEAEYPSARPAQTTAAPVYETMPAPIQPSAPQSVEEARPAYTPSPEPAPVAAMTIPAEPVARPYPGSRPDTYSDRRPASPSPRPAHDPYAETTSQNRYNEPGEFPEPGRVSSRDHQPHMAPSLRKRNEAKKRGFFKRLFGIK
jgi:hypothetical protein